MSRPAFRMDPLPYLTRISHPLPTDPDLAALRGLHLAHLRRVPFENLDIHLGRSIALDLENLFAKIVLARRGGFCYELNGLFGWLLRRLGFRVSLHSAGVARPDGSFGPEFDHLVLRVQFPQEGSDDHAWLADVGFGDSFLEPLPIVAGLVNVQAGRSYRLGVQEGGFRLMRLDEHGGWRPQYRFTLKEWSLPDFDPMCIHHQTSPHSSFTQHCTSTIATEGGRITLADFRLITTHGRTREERVVIDAGDYAEILTRRFGIELPEADLDRLTSRVSRLRQA